MIYQILRRLIIPHAYTKIQRIVGLENILTQGGFILAANHVSWFDPVYLTAAVSRRFHERLLFISATAKHAWTQAVIPIRKNDRAACLEIAFTELQRGNAIGLFPHGDQRKSTDGAMTGTARLARRAHCPIIPAALRSLAPGHTLTSLREYFRGTKSIEIVFGEPILLDTSQTITHEQLHEDMGRIDHLISTLLHSLAEQP